MPDEMAEITKEPDERDSTEPGKRDLDYGHAFGTERDRSQGGQAKYFEDRSDDWQDAVPERDEE